MKCRVAMILPSYVSVGQKQKVYLRGIKVMALNSMGTLISLYLLPGNCVRCVAVCFNGKLKKKRLVNKQAK